MPKEHKGVRGRPRRRGAAHAQGSPVIKRRRKILIFHDHLLRRSETFILAQGGALQHFDPYYAGSRAMNELALPPDHWITINPHGEAGKLLEIPFKLFGHAPEFMRQIRAIHPALIHAQFGPDGVLALPIARALHVPLIVTFGGHDATVVRDALRYPFYNSHQIYFRREAALQREGRLFIAVSDFIRRKLLDRGFSPHRTVVHYRGVDTRLFKPDSEKPRRPLVLFVGRLVEVKGCEYLIRAMKRVQSQARDAGVVIAGDGPLRPSLEKLAREEKLSACIFAGWQSPEDIRRWLNEARVLCAPSIVTTSGAEEGFSNAILEAMACGLPVVSFANGGNSEAVEHGRTGFLAPEKDIEQLSAHIVRLIQEDELWNGCSHAGLTRVRSMFDLTRQTEELEAIYRQVLDSPGVSNVGN